MYCGIRTVESYQHFPGHAAQLQVTDNQVYRIIIFFSWMLGGFSTHYPTALLHMLQSFTSVTGQDPTTRMFTVDPKAHNVYVIVQHLQCYSACSNRLFRSSLRITLYPPTHLHNIWCLIPTLSRQVNCT